MKIPSPSDRQSRTGEGREWPAKPIRECCPQPGKGSTRTGYQRFAGPCRSWIDDNRRSEGPAQAQFKLAANSGLGVQSEHILGCSHELPGVLFSPSRSRSQSQHIRIRARPSGWRRRRGYHGRRGRGRTSIRRRREPNCAGELPEPGFEYPATNRHRPKADVPVGKSCGRRWHPVD